jgi:transcriptional regulator GlxA family with amidase domain
MGMNLMKQAFEDMGSGADLSGVTVLKRAATGHRGVDRSLGYMARKFCQPIRVTDLVKASGLSRRGFFKAFEKHVGIRPGKLLTHARIEYAKQLLAGSRLTLGDVARQSGYRSANTFWVAFRRIAGVAPAVFQRQRNRSRARRQRLTGKSVEAGFREANR